jgi:hypothetical protein
MRRWSMRASSLADNFTTFVLNWADQDVGAIGMIIDVPELQEQVSRALRDGPLADQVREIEIEPAEDEDGSEFLRVIVKLVAKKAPEDSELDDLLQLIEDTISKIDDRYPSVRFLDAA